MVECCPPVVPPLPPAPRWGRPRANADTPIHPRPAPPPCPGGARRRANRGAPAAPCRHSRERGCTIGARRGYPQPPRWQHPPHPTHGEPREPLHRHPPRAQRPAARGGPTLRPRHFPPGRLARPGAQGLTPFLLHGCVLRAAPSDAPHRVGGPKVRLRPRSHRPVTTQRAGPGPAASALPGSPPPAAPRPPQSLVTPRPAHVRRAANPDRDSVPTLAVRAFLAPTFVGVPSLGSWQSRWLYMTDFDRQSSLAARNSQAFAIRRLSWDCWKRYWQERKRNRSVSATDQDKRCPEIGSGKGLLFAYRVAPGSGLHQLLFGLP